MEPKTKICWNCGNLMGWNEIEERYECLVCGYCEETKLRKEIPTYVN